MSRAPVSSVPQTDAVEVPAPPPTPQQLVQSCQGLVRSLAWQIHKKCPPQVELDDLIAYGQVGLAQAASEFDPARANQFTTYAYYRIRGAILDGLSQLSWFRSYDSRRRRYTRMANELLRQNSEDGEGVATADVNEEVRWLARLAGSLSVIYLASDLERDESAETLRVADRCETPPAEAIARELRAQLASLIDELPEGARALIRATYFEGMTLYEAGKRIGMSKASASRLHAKALAQLGRSLRRSGAFC